MFNGVRLQPVRVVYTDWWWVQAMEQSYSELAKRYQGSHVQVAKFQADVDRDFAAEKLGLRTFPTIVALPKGHQGYIKYPSETRDADTLDMWVRTVAGYQ